VGHAAGQPSDRLHLLGLAKLRPALSASCIRALRETDRRPETSPATAAFEPQSCAVRRQALEKMSRDLTRNDVLARKRSHEIETLYKTAPLGMAMIDRNRRFLKVNRHFADLTGHSVETLIGRAPTGGELDGANVLLLEDEFLIAMDAEQILKDLGAAKVEIAGTLADAERLAEGGGFDVAMLDVNINGQVSFPLAERLWRRGVAVVFATGYETRNYGFPEFAVCVTKPYTSADVREVFSAALRRRAG